MYNIAICEDEKVQVSKMIDILTKHEKSENIKFNIDSFESGEELIENGYEKYHIIFMDVQMNDLNGIETAKLIRKTNKKVKIIFITAMEKYWAEGYTVSAYRYMLKPIKEEVFSLEFKGLLNEMNKEKNFISLNNEGALLKISISQIKYLEIVGRRVAIHTNKGMYYSNMSIGHWNGILIDHGFANPHNSYLVNLKYVVALDKEKVSLLSGDTVYMSKRKYKEFKDRFTIFLGSI